MRNAAALVGIEQCTLSLFMTEQRRGVTGQLADPVIYFVAAHESGRLRGTDRLGMQPLAHGRPDLLGHSLSRRATVDKDAALRLYGGESPISLAQLLVKLCRFSLKPICGILPTTALCARQTYLSGDIHDECQLR